jgi:hypothetical protein
MPHPIIKHGLFISLFIVLNFGFGQRLGLPFDKLERIPELPALPNVATYFVAREGDDNNNGKSETTAFKSIFKAIQVAEAGDVVFIREGSYHEDNVLRFKTSGTKNQPITFMSYPGEQATIQWSGHEGGSEKESVVFDGADYIILRDLIIRDGPQQCLLLINAADNNYFINMQFLDCWGSGFQIYEGSNNVVAYSRALGNYGGGNSDGFGSVGQGGESDANEFWYNIAGNNSDDGFDTWKGTNTLLFGNISFENGYNDGDGNGFKLGSNGILNKGIIQRNIAFNNARDGFDTNLGGGNLVENNTAYGNQRHNFENARAIEANIFRNNLSANGSVGMFSEPIEENNSWNLELGDPRFVSSDHHDNGFLSLQIDSPVIDQGLIGNLSFKGTAPDLGALEFGQELVAYHLSD